jgi:hypothetical protein
MRSEVAEAIRREQLEEIRLMSASQRVALARELGARDLRAYMAVQTVDREAALGAIRRSRQVGRRYSRCMDESAS